MPRTQSWNPRPLTAELSASDEAINPLLEAAKITSIKVDGKDVAASDAPLQHRISAYAALCKANVASTDITELATLNSQITEQLTKESERANKAEASVAALTQEKSTLAADLEISKNAVAKLTADYAEVSSRNTILADQLSAMTGKVNSNNEALSMICIAGNVLDLRDKDGKVFGKDTAGEQAKLIAANAIPFEAKLAAYQGAVNAAVAKTGGILGEAPVGVPAGGSSPKKNLTRAEYCAMTPAQQLAYVKTGGKITD